MSSTITSWWVSLGEYPCFWNSFFRYSFTYRADRMMITYTNRINIHIRSWYIKNSSSEEFHTSSLESFQSSLRSISRNDSWDLGPFWISMSSMSKMRVLLGGIFPVYKQKHECKRSTDMVTQEAGEIRCNRHPQHLFVFRVHVTFSFLAISQRWRNSQFPALSFAHVL